jgi:hypothetical protein
VITNGETHQVIDVLPGRDAGPLMRWLTDHPGIEVICRDRSGSYATIRGRPRRCPAGETNCGRVASVEEPRRGPGEDGRRPPQLHPGRVRDTPGHEGGRHRGSGHRGVVHRGEHPVRSAGRDTRLRGAPTAPGGPHHRTLRSSAGAAGRGQDPGRDPP